MKSVGAGRTWYYVVMPIPEIEAENGDLIMINRRRGKLYVCKRHSAVAYGALLANLDKVTMLHTARGASRPKLELVP